MRTKFLVYLVLLAGALGVLGYYYYQRNIYSREVVRLEIFSNEEPDAFEEVEYLVKYKNNGNIALEDVELLFQFPENSLPSDGKSIRVTESLEDIYPGEERTVSFKGRLVGKVRDVKKAEATLRYRPKGLKAFFESSTTFTSRINSVPLTFETDFPSKIESGKEIQFSLNYFSNSDWPIPNLRVKIEYPPGFEYISSKPKALDNVEWELPLLNKTEGGRVDIKGKIFGNQREQKTIKITLGMWQEGNFIVLKEITRSAEIIRPAIAVVQQINGNPSYTANFGDLLHYEIFFRNVGQEPFQDLFLIARLEGQIFDFDTVRTDVGKFNKGENFILWDWRDVPKLKLLEGGEEGKVEFWVALKSNLENKETAKNLVLKNQVTVSQVREVFETKVNTKLEVTQKAYFSDEIFQSSGAMPPRVAQTTNYTIVWEIKNYYNDARSLSVKAFLPPQSKLTGKIFPEGTSLTFDSQSREVVWTIDVLPAGTGITTPPITIAFQIAFVPEASQVGQTPIILNRVTVSGQDDWTNSRVEGSYQPLTTALSSDIATSGAVQN